MKLKEYLENLNELLNKHPEAAEYIVITAIDDEGNGYNTVHCGPSIGSYDDYDYTSEGKANAVCVN